MSTGSGDAVSKGASDAALMLARRKTPRATPFSSALTSIFVVERNAARVRTKTGACANRPSTNTVSQLPMRSSDTSARSAAYSCASAATSSDLGIVAEARLLTGNGPTPGTPDGRIISPASMARTTDACASIGTTLSAGGTVVPARISISRPPMNRDDGTGEPAASTFSKQSRDSGNASTRVCPLGSGERMAMNQVPVERTVAS